MANDETRVLQSEIEENQAIMAYDEREKESESPKVKRTFKDLKEEEMAHKGELLQRAEEVDPKLKEKVQEGREEAKEVKKNNPYPYNYAYEKGGDGDPKGKKNKRLPEKTSEPPSQPPAESHYNDYEEKPEQGSFKELLENKKSKAPHTHFERSGGGTYKMNRIGTVFLGTGKKWNGLMCHHEEPCRDEATGKFKVKEAKQIQGVSVEKKEMDATKNVAGIKKAAKKPAGKKPPAKKKKNGFEAINHSKRAVKPTTEETVDPKEAAQIILGRNYSESDEEMKKLIRKLKKEIAHQKEPVKKPKTEPKEHLTIGDIPTQVPVLDKNGKQVYENGVAKMEDYYLTPRDLEIAVKHLLDKAGNSEIIPPNGSQGETTKETDFAMNLPMSLRAFIRGTRRGEGVLDRKVGGRRAKRFMRGEAGSIYGLMNRVSESYRDRISVENFIKRTEGNGKKEWEAMAKKIWEHRFDFVPNGDNNGNRSKGFSKWLDIKDPYLDIELMRDNIRIQNGLPPEILKDEESVLRYLLKVYTPNAVAMDTKRRREMAKYLQETLEEWTKKYPKITLGKTKKDKDGKPISISVHDLVKYKLKPFEGNNRELLFDFDEIPTGQTVSELENKQRLKEGKSPLKIKDPQSVHGQPEPGWAKASYFIDELHPTDIGGDITDSSKSVAMGSPTRTTFSEMTPKEWNALFQIEGTNTHFQNLDFERLDGESDEDYEKRMGSLIAEALREDSLDMVAVAQSYRSKRNGLMLDNQYLDWANMYSIADRFMNAALDEIVNDFADYMEETGQLEKQGISKEQYLVSNRIQLVGGHVHNIYGDEIVEMAKAFNPYFDPSTKKLGKKIISMIAAYPKMFAPQNPLHNVLINVRNIMAAGATEYSSEKVAEREKPNLNNEFRKVLEQINTIEYPDIKDGEEVVNTLKVGNKTLNEMKRDSARRHPGGKKVIYFMKDGKLMMSNENPEKPQAFAYDEEMPRKPHDYYREVSESTTFVDPITGAKSYLKRKGKVPKSVAQPLSSASVVPEPASGMPAKEEMVVDIVDSGGYPHKDVIFDESRDPSNIKVDELYPFLEHNYDYEYIFDNFFKNHSDEIKQELSKDTVLKLYNKIVKDISNISLEDPSRKQEYLIKIKKYIDDFSADLLKINVMDRQASKIESDPKSEMGAGIPPGENKLKYVYFDNISNEITSPETTVLFTIREIDQNRIKDMFINILKKISNDPGINKINNDQISHEIGDYVARSVLKDGYVREQLTNSIDEMFIKIKNPSTSDERTIRDKLINKVSDEPLNTINEISGPNGSYTRRENRLKKEFYGLSDNPMHHLGHKGSLVKAPKEVEDQLRAAGVEIPPEGIYVGDADHWFSRGGLLTPLTEDEVERRLRGEEIERVRNLLGGSFEFGDRFESKDYKAPNNNAANALHEFAIRNYILDKIKNELGKNNAIGIDNDIKKRYDEIINNKDEYIKYRGPAEEKWRITLNEGFRLPNVDKNVYAALNSDTIFSNLLYSNDENDQILFVKISQLLSDPEIDVNVELIPMIGEHFNDPDKSKHIENLVKYIHQDHAYNKLGLQSASNGQYTDETHMLRQDNSIDGPLAGIMDIEKVVQWLNDRGRTIYHQNLGNPDVYKMMFDELRKHSDLKHVSDKDLAELFVKGVDHINDEHQKSLEEFKTPIVDAPDPKKINITLSDTIQALDSELEHGRNISADPMLESMNSTISKYGMGIISPDLKYKVDILNDIAKRGGMRIHRDQVIGERLMNLTRELRYKIETGTQLSENDDVVRSLLQLRDNYPQYFKNDRYFGDAKNGKSIFKLLDQILNIQTKGGKLSDVDLSVIDQPTISRNVQPVENEEIQISYEPHDFDTPSVLTPRGEDAEKLIDRMKNVFSGHYIKDNKSRLNKLYETFMLSRAERSDEEQQKMVEEMYNGTVSDISALERQHFIKDLRNKAISSNITPKEKKWQLGGIEILANAMGLGNFHKALVKNPNLELPSLSSKEGVRRIILDVVDRPFKHNDIVDKLISNPDILAQLPAISRKTLPIIFGVDTNKEFNIHDARNIRTQDQINRHIDSGELFRPTNVVYTDGETGKDVVETEERTIKPLSIEEDPQTKARVEENLKRWYAANKLYNEHINSLPSAGVTYNPHMFTDSIFYENGNPFTVEDADLITTKIHPKYRTDLFGDWTSKVLGINNSKDLEKDITSYAENLFNNSVANAANEEFVNKDKAVSRDRERVIGEKAKFGKSRSQFAKLLKEISKIKKSGNSKRDFYIDLGKAAKNCTTYGMVKP